MHRFDLISKPLALVVVGAIVLATGMGSSVFAATATPSATPQPSATPDLTDTNQKIKDLIKKSSEKYMDQIKGVLDDLSQQKKGFVGEVQRVSAESITIKTDKATQIISLNGNVSLTKQGKTISVDDIAVGDWVIVISKIQNDDLIPERVVVSSTTLRPLPQVVTIGSISDLTKTKMSVAAKINSQVKDFLITKNTQYQDMNGDTIKLTQVTKDLQVLVIAQTTDKGDELKVVRILEPLSK